MYYSNYFSIFIFICIGFFVSSLIYGLSYLFATIIEDSEKNSIYECGFDPYGDARNTFDVRFYLVAIFFIVFDLESIYVFPWIISLSHLGSIGFWIMFDFIIELLIGFIYIWKINALEWN